MKSQYLQNKFKIIDEAFIKAKTSTSDPQLAYMLSAYLVVFISGAYEDCIEYLFVKRAGKNNDKEIESLVKELIDRQFRNPNYDKITQLIKALNLGYVSILNSKIDTQSKTGINSIVQNKNKIAHGETSNATLNDVINYHNSATKIFEVLEDILL